MIIVKQNQFYGDPQVSDTPSFDGSKRSNIKFVLDEQIKINLGQSPQVVQSALFHVLVDESVTHKKFGDYMFQY